MTPKPFTPEQFTATQFSTQKEKADFANHLVRFVLSGFKQSLFFDWFYRRLSFTFGHIAEFNRHGFYEVWFSTTINQLEFLRNITRAHCVGDPAYTFSDVERAIKQWLAGTNLIAEYTKKVTEEVEKAERAELQRLTKKYGA